MNIYRDTEQTQIKPGTDIEPGSMVLIDPVWKDENFDPSSARIGATVPDLINLNSSNILVTAFNGANTLEAVHSHRELNHDYKEGTDLLFHIHWAPSTIDSGNVKWQIEYYISGGNENIVKSSGTMSLVTASSGTAWETIAVSFGSVAGTNFKIGDQVSLRLFRDPADTQDTYGADAIVKTFGYHYEIDTLGSSQVFVK